MLRAVLFDFGDTLAYLWVPKAERFGWLCRQAGVDVAPERAHAAAVAYERAWARGSAGPSLGWRGSLPAYAAGLRAAGYTRPDPLAGRIWCVAEALEREIRPDPAAAALLAELRGAGLQTGVISNHFGLLAEHLGEIGLGAHWDVVLDAAKVHLCKPDPRIFALACRRLGLQPGEVVYVGDEPRADVEGALAAGAAAVLLDPLGAYAEAGDAVRRVDGLAAVACALGIRLPRPTQPAAKGHAGSDASGSPLAL